MKLLKMSLTQKTLPLISLLTAVAISLTACGTLQVRLDGQALAASKDVAKLEIQTHQQFPGQPFDYHSWATLISVDGVPAPQSGVVFVQLSPGAHSLKYTCGIRGSVNATNWITGQDEGMFTLRAGVTYWPTVGYHSNGTQMPPSCAVPQLQDIDPIVQAL
jgi:hypothetical protein